MKTLKLTLVLISLIAWLAGVAEGQIKQRMDVTVWTESKAKVVYTRDSTGTFIYYRDVIDEIIAENWKLKDENYKLKDLYAKVLKIARDTRKELDDVKKRGGATSR